MLADQHEPERQQVDRAVEAESEYETEDAAQGEGAFLEAPQIEEGMRAVEASPDRAGAGDDTDQDAEINKRPLPAVFRRFLEHEFKCREEHGGEADGEVVDATPFGRVRLAKAHEGRDERRYSDARNEIDQEDPVPGVMLGQVAADGRADRVRND